MSGYISRMTRIPLNKVIRISERTIRPENEFKVKEILVGVEKQVKTWPGLLSMETLVDTEKPHKYIVITEVIMQSSQQFQPISLFSNLSSSDDFEI